MLSAKRMEFGVTKQNFDAINYWSVFQLAKLTEDPSAAFSFNGCQIITKSSFSKRISLKYFRSGRSFDADELYFLLSKTFYCS